MTDLATHGDAEISLGDKEQEADLPLEENGKDRGLEGGEKDDSNDEKVEREEDKEGAEAGEQEAEEREDQDERQSNVSATGEAEEKEEEEEEQTSQTKEESDNIEGEAGEATTHDEQLPTETSPSPPSEDAAVGEQQSDIQNGTREALDAAADKDLPTTNKVSTSLISGGQPLENAHVCQSTPQKKIGFQEEETPTAEEKLTPTYNRQALLDKYYGTLLQRANLMKENSVAQTRLVVYFRKKKTDDRMGQSKNFADQEHRYLKLIAQMDELLQLRQADMDNISNQEQELNVLYEEKRDYANEERQAFVEFKRRVAQSALYSRSGRPIAAKDIEQFLCLDNKKEADVMNVRLENIKLKNKVKKSEITLKSKEELAKGLHLIDFEQLKIENQALNEKIEERNEDLLKLRKKINRTVQVLTHQKAKLHFIKGENSVLNIDLKNVDAALGKKRDILSRTKKARDVLRMDNQRLYKSGGLQVNHCLLRDFEVQKDTKVQLQTMLDHLKTRHAQLILNCNQMRRKIDRARGLAR